MAHQGFDLQLTRHDEPGWRATFYTTGMEHSPRANVIIALNTGLRLGELLGLTRERVDRVGASSASR